MFSELNKYTGQGHFFVTGGVSLNEVCNAPANKGGVYLVYALKAGSIELVYIGRSGRMDENSNMIIRKTGLGGMHDRIVNGHHFGYPSGVSPWNEQIKKYQLEALDIYWYVTHDKNFADNPVAVKNLLLSIHQDIYGHPPAWNR